MLLLHLLKLMTIGLWFLILHTWSISGTDYFGEGTPTVHSWNKFPLVTARDYFNVYSVC